MLTTVPPLHTDDSAPHKDYGAVHKDKNAVHKANGAVHKAIGAVQKDNVAVHEDYGAVHKDCGAVPHDVFLLCTKTLKIKSPKEKKKEKSNYSKYTTKITPYMQCKFSSGQLSFVEILSKYCPSQTVRAREMKFWDNVQPHHVSHDTFQMSHAMRHKFYYLYFLQSVRAS